MGYLEDIIEGAKNAGSAIFGGPGSGSVMDAATANSPMRRHARLMEIEDFARQQGYTDGKGGLESPLKNPDFIQAFPELAAEADEIEQALSTGFVPGGVAVAGGGALTAARGAAGSGRAIPPPRATPEEIIRSTQGGPGRGLPPSGEVIEGSVVTHGRAGASASPSAGSALPSGQRALPPGQGAAPSQPQAVSGAVIPPPSPNAPATAGVGNTPGGGPQIINGQVVPPRGPGAAPAGLPPVGGPGAAAASPGILGQIANVARNNAGKIGAALGVGVAAGGALAAAGAANQPKPPRYGPTLEEADANAARIEAERADAKRRDAAAAASARRIRGDEADIGLTESQAQYYNALREKALKELANADLTDSEKAELAHNFAMQEIEARAGAERENTMIRETGENERTDTRERGANTRARFQGDVEMRGQDQRAREAQDSFVTNWLQNQIANGQLSLDRATKLMEAYQKQQALPSEILNRVSEATARMEQYRTTAQPGGLPPGFEKGGVMAGLAKAAGVKFNPENYRVQETDWQQIARDYGAIPNAAPPPTVDQVFAGAGQGADMSPEGIAAIRGASASNTMLPRPDLSNYSEPMPDDSMQRIMGGLR